MTSNLQEPIRVLHVFGRMNRGGAEMRTLDVMQSLDPTKYALDYCVLSGLHGDLDESVQALGGRVYRCKLNAMFPLKFLRLLRQQQFDVVHSHVLYISGLILFLARLAGVPVRVAHFRTTGSGRPVTLGRRLRDAFLRSLIDFSATKIVAVSQGAMDACWSRYRGPDARSQVIYNGIGRSIDNGKDESLGREFGFHLDSPLVIHVGRFSEPKNHGRLLAIFREIKRIDDRAVLLLVGGGNDQVEQEVRHQVDVQGLSGSVRFAGLRNDVPRLLRGANVMVFPSKWEGLPGTVLEAIAAGTPVVATDLPGVMEIAARLPGVSPIPLEADDAHWAKTAIDVMKNKREPSVAGDIVQQSEFGIETAMNKHMELWRGC